MTSDIKKLMNTRDNFKRKAILTNNENDWLISKTTIDIYLSGLLARRQNAWSQDGGNMRVIANGVNR